MNLRLCFLAVYLYLHSCLRTISFFILNMPSLSAVSCETESPFLFECQRSVSAKGVNIKFLNLSQQQLSFLKLLFFFSFVFSRSLILAAEWISLSLILQFISWFFSALLVVLLVAFTQRKLKLSFLSALTLKDNRLVLSVLPLSSAY